MNKNFDVEIKKDKYGIYLSVTHNGYQWTTITFKNDDELENVNKVINDYFLYGITRG